jgi:hypothetical protein
MWREGWAPNNAIKWQMGLNLAFKSITDEMASKNSLADGWKMQLTLSSLSDLVPTFFFYSLQYKLPSKNILHIKYLKNSKIILYNAEYIDCLKLKHLTVRFEGSSGVTNRAV